MPPAGEDKITALPPHVAALLHPTPSGTVKLVAAWDGLHVETQILILQKVPEPEFPKYLRDKILVKALESPNAYVRYLAARSLHFSKDDDAERQAIKARIESDPDPLVRYCLLETDDFLSAILDSTLKDADAFFRLPHDARLAKVRNNWSHSGEKIAALVSHAVDHQLKDGTVSEIELFEILSDYVSDPAFRAYYNEGLSIDGWGEYSKGKDLQALWELVPVLPEGISHVLIEHLPYAGGLSSGISEAVLKSMTDRQLVTLLSRRDIELDKLRKQLFWETNEARDHVRWAAISHHFDLEYGEFASILAKPEKDKVRCLNNLTDAADLRLVFFDAIHDVLSRTRDRDLSGVYEWSARDALERGLAQLMERKRDRVSEPADIRELRLYRLARTAVPWKKVKTGYPPDGELAFLADKVVDGDTWATFMAFSEAWEKEGRKPKPLEQWLPRIDELPEDDVVEEPAPDEYRLRQAEQLVKRFASRLSKMLSALPPPTKGHGVRVAEAVGKLAAHITASQTKALQAVTLLRTEVSELQAAQRQQRVLLYVIVAFLIGVLWKLW